MAGMCAPGGEYTHVVISVSDIQRPVCFKPDFSGPVCAEENTPYWLELLSEAVLADKKRCNTEKAQYDKQLKDQRDEVSKYSQFRKSKDQELCGLH